MTRSLNVVVTCTDRKSLPSQPGLSVGSLKESRPAARAAAWISRLESARGEVLPVRDLYLGNHWSIVRSLAREANGLDVKVWVASAGYGLLPIDTVVHAYSATFSSGPDSVGDSDAGRIWWEALSKWNGVNVTVRSIDELARVSGQTPLIVAASATYMTAMSSDIVAAGRRLTPKRLGLISAGLRREGELQPFVVPTDARFKQKVIGPMQSLNASILQYAIRRSADWYPEITELRTQFKKELESLPAVTLPNRARQTDADVVAFIRAETAASPRIARGTLLRKLRSNGLACEQARFKQLYIRALATQ